MFALGELDDIVASLAFRRRLRVVLPFFSEADVAVEHDALSIVCDTVSRGRPAWLVRFADPIITARYIIDARSRTVLDVQTRQRRSGILFHLFRKP